MSAAWLRVCPLSALEVERGRAALIDGTQIALFLLGDGSVHAVSNCDPFSGAHVISRGIVGSKADAPTVASPIYKQVFDLRTGQCVDPQGKEPAHLRVWPVARRDDDIYIRWEETP
ncbi:nitrite reductase small subunit NirD [Microbacterium sp.]|uniref:nitrite reductase small subunit NirD n=1 Tax=Microbacterium sp. TaxID=51671 RepID=UPI0032221A13